jgi:glutathione peroxidase-family protein
MRALMNATGRVPEPIANTIAYSPQMQALDAGIKTVVKKKVSAYNRRYATAFRKLKKTHTLASGKYRKGWNFKKLVKAAHKVAKR